MGSGVPIHSIMAAADLVEEYLLTIHPVVLGRGATCSPRARTHRFGSRARVDSRSEWVRTSVRPALSARRSATTAWSACSTTKVSEQSKVYDTGISEWGLPGNPVVYAKCDEGAPKTVVIYWQYDTMPVTEPDVWKVPPFDADIIAENGFKKR